MSKTLLCANYEGGMKDMPIKIFGLERGMDEINKEFVMDLFAPVSKVKHVMTDSKAGTGKTTLAVAVGVRERQEGRYQNGIYYFSFPSKRAEKLGSRPGTLEEKEAAYFRPLIQALHVCQIHNALAFGVYMSTGSDWRGGNISDAYVIIDEAQNAEIDDLQLIYTRCSDDCKIVTIGSSLQCDNNVKRYGNEKLIPFQVYIHHQLQKDYTRVHTLMKNYRGEQANHSDEINDTIKWLQGQ